MKTIFISIDYDEINQDSYNGFIITVLPEEKIHKIFSGDPVADYKESIKYIKTNFNNILVMRSSSLDHFVFDGNKYIWDNDGNLQLNHNYNSNY